MKPDRYSLGLTGYPLGHSLSPVIHQTALRETGLEGDYKLYPIVPGAEGNQSLSALIDRLRGKDCADGLQGLNVTIPHKEVVFSLVDELTDVAKTVKAVNTVYYQDGVLFGDNTDVPGFLADLDRLSPGLVSCEDCNKHALILGAGGSARAVAYALATCGWSLSLVYLRPQSEGRARKLADEMVHDQYEVDFIGISSLADQDAELVVNCTPLGMTPNTEASPWPGDIQFPENAFVYDLVYNPLDTLLVSAAQAVRLKASTGLGMLVYQAALAFERWTRCKPPFEPLFRAAEQQLMGM